MASVDVIENGAETSSVQAIADTLSKTSISDGGDTNRKIEKDPRIIARKYQMDLCKKAVCENTIAYLGTGCGKTHIAVLLIYEMRHLIKKPQNNICVFLAPTVALVEQQAKVIEDSIDVEVGTYCGSKQMKGHKGWEKELDQHEVLVMTPQILLHCLSHCCIRKELIALLIFDECHYAQVESNHPYAEIMKVFYKDNNEISPRIFGMTASPILGKGASISGLETLLRSKVYSVEDKEELELFVTSPKFTVYYYATAVDSTSCLLTIIYNKLEKIKSQCVSDLSSDPSSSRSTKKILQSLHINLCFCIEKLGLWGALQAAHILLRGNSDVRDELVEMEEQSIDDPICDKYLTQAAIMLYSYCMEEDTQAKLNSLEVLEEPFFSQKLLKLIDILSNFRLQPNMKCIIFVNRIVTARSLSSILQNLKVLSAWKCDFLVGVHSGVKCVSRKSTNAMLEKFRSGELNLLVATKVGEEGLDIQTCCLVIRFDLPETVASFIQSRGRARMPQSEYVLLVDRDDDRELNLIRSFTEEEYKMNQEIECRTSAATFGDLEEKTYKVESTRATISSGCSISLLHRYCSKLTHDEFFHPKPQFSYFDDADGTVCQIILPSNAPIHLVSSSPQTSKDGAKRDACLQACRNLHQLGALTDYLLPEQDDENEDMLQYYSDSDCSDDEDTRKELHEMLVPAVLQEQWSKTENSVQLSSYFVKFRPHPEDRDYKPFGLFVKVSLPGEAEKMKLDLHLVRGRSVVAELIPSRAMPFNRDEIVLAEKFQEMFLKVIIDRSDFISDYVPLGINDYGSLASRTCYLMLPVIWCEYEEAMTIDWKLVRRCLSSPIFRMPEVSEGDGLPQPSKQLHLANGRKNIHDVVNSLIYVPRKDIFYFIADVVLEKNALSEYKRSKSHIQHYSEKFGIDLLHPSQPLLKAKQLFRLDNLLRKKGHLDSREKEEHFVELPPEICQLKIIGFSKDIGSSLSLLPSIMHRLESLLVAVELKHVFSASFPEGAEVTALRVLEALTTENCNEHFSLERLEVLGDAFLKFAVGRRLFLLHEALDEGQLTRKRSNVVNNTNLLKLATTNNLQVYIRDQSFNPKHFFTLGRPCSVVCSEETQKSLHPPCGVDDCADIELRCNKSHHWLHKKTIADVVEALVGAFIVDSGFKAATAFLKWMGIQVEFEVSRVSHICSASAIYIPLADHIDIAALENSIGYHFANKGLLVQAFVHPSYNFHSGGCYQRLEFLGDAVLDYLITSYLYSVYPNLKPGQLTDLRSTCVNNNCFADIAINRSFYKFIISDSVGLCNAMDKYVKFARTPQLDGDEVEAPACPKVLGDLVESCVGAILLDTGFDLNRVWKIMLSFLDPVINFSRLQLNPIRELHELCQSHGMDIDFASSKKDTTFSVEVKVNGKGVSECSFASNFNKKAAKREAAKQAVSNLKEQGYKPKSKSLEEVLKSTQKMKAKLIGYNEASSSYNEISSNVSSSHGNETNNLKVQDCYQSCASPKLATGTNNLMVQDSYQSCASPKVATGTNNLKVQDSYQTCASPKVASGTNNLKVQDSYQSCASPKLATGTNNLKIQDSYKTCASPKLAHVTGTNNLKVQDSYKSCASPKVHPLGIEPNRSGHAEIKPVRRTSYPNDSQECQLVVNDNTNSCSSGTQTSGGSIKKTSKSRLYEICAANCWKPPVFECYKETGESHLKEFTFKVTVVPDGLDSVVAIGRPAGRKKEAAETAAEGAVWYLYKSNTIRS